MKFINLLILVVILSFTACDENYEHGVIIDGGDPAVDGCGWLIRISSVDYKPKELPQELQIHNLDVKVKYDLLNTKADCGFAQDVFYEIRLVEIDKL